jgi:hypothetical protein
VPKKGNGRRKDRRKKVEKAQTNKMYIDKVKIPNDFFW